MKWKVATAALLLTLPLCAQQSIQGYIKDNTGAAAIGANVIIKGTYDGTSADVDGSYQLTVSPQDTLVFSYLGFVEEVYIVPNTDGNPLTYDVDLEPVVNLLAQATVSGARNREIVKLSSRHLSQMNVFTTAGDPGNILLAAQGGASASVNPASGRLLARGGRADETQFYMDGMVLNAPYINTITGVNTRLRQNPFMVEHVDMYNGTASAEYGQALSSVFSLNTRQRIRQNQVSVNASTVGVNANIAQKTGKGGLMYNLDFLNMRLNNQLTVNNVNWLQPYQSINNQLIWDIPLGEDRQIRCYASHSTGDMQLNTLYEGAARDIYLRGDQLNFSFSYKQLIGQNWDVTASAMYQSESSQTAIREVLDQNTGSGGMHAKVVLRHYAKGDLSLKAGSELFFRRYDEQVFFDEASMSVNNNFDYTNAAVFAEAEKKWSAKFTSRLGIRADDLNLPKPDVSLRALMGWHFTKTTSLTASWGTFTQAAPVAYRFYQPNLGNERSEQFILSLAREKNNRKIAASAFNKRYAQLSRAADNYPFYPETINDTGSGYVQGFDVTLEDKKTFKNGELFLSYAWMDAKRNDRNYTARITPDYLYPHQLTFRTQRFLPGISSNVSLSAVWMGGKIADNPWTTELIERDEVGAYSNLSLNYTYITRLFGSDISYIHLSIDNLLNIDNEVGLFYPDPTQVITQKANTRRSLFLAVISNF